MQIKPIMAKQLKTGNTSTRITNAKKSRKGIHAKSKASRSKKAKNYFKRNVGQGK